MFRQVVGLEVNEVMALGCPQASTSASSSSATLSYMRNATLMNNSSLGPGFDFPVMLCVSVMMDKSHSHLPDLSSNALRVGRIDS